MQEIFFGRANPKFHDWCHQVLRLENWKEQWTGKGTAPPVVRSSSMDTDGELDDRDDLKICLQDHDAGQTLVDS
jgi:hypothetical protein